VSVSRRSFSLGALLLLASDDARADEETGDLFARIGRARALVRTLKGPFEQTRTVGLLATDVRSRGVLVLVRPDRLRWQLSPPDDVTFWVGPGGLAYKSAHGGGHLPAPNGGISGALDDLRSLLGGDLARLRERWELRVVRDDPSGAEIDATPRAGVRVRLQNIRFSLDPDLARPSRVLLVEGPHDRTAIEFGALAVNEPVDEALMKPPP
jgi:hypothetical protein